MWNLEVFFKLSTHSTKCMQTTKIAIKASKYLEHNEATLHPFSNFTNVISFWCDLKYLNFLY